METHPYLETSGLEKQLNLTTEEIILEEYNNGGIWFPNTNVIVCGTFPPRKEYYNRKGYIHFSSSKNKFWKHIDSIYNLNLYANNNKSDNIKLRIANSKEKIKFLKNKNIGFVDIFTKISRKDLNSSKDDDIIEPYETIFDGDILNSLLNSSVENIVFVYSKSYNAFIKYLREKLPEVSIYLIREYKKDNITLRVECLNINNKKIYLSYSPIHGRIKDFYKRCALKKAIDNNYS
jgi:G:T/U-mismatch repair DNA glycosylase